MNTEIGRGEVDASREAYEAPSLRSLGSWSTATAFSVSGGGSFPIDQLYKQEELDEDLF